MGWLKKILIGAGALGGLAALGLGALVLTFDPNHYKGQITSLVKTKKNRDLQIDGDLKLSVFPNLAVNLGASTLSDYKSSQNFLTLRSAKLSLEWLPLLRKQLVVNAVQVDGLQANITRDAAGRYNFDDLSEGGGSGQPSQFKFEVDAITLTDSQVTINDAKANVMGVVRNISLRSGRLADKTPTHINLDALFDLQRPRTNAQVKLSGGLLFDTQAKLTQFTQAQANITGDLPNFKRAAIAINGDVSLDGNKDSADTKNLSLNIQGDFLPSGKGSKPVEQLNFKLTAPRLFAAIGALQIDADNIDLASTGMFDKM